MRLIATPDDVIDNKDRAIWMTRPFDLSFTVGYIIGKINISSLGNDLALTSYDDIEIFPYNYTEISPFFKANYSLMRSNERGVSNAALIRITISPSNEERLRLARYFQYWRCNPLTISLDDKLVVGYLTPNNKELLNHQFNPENPVPIVIELEAVKGK